MYARVTTAQVRPGKMDETLAILEQSFYLELGQKQGFKGALLLTNREAEKVIGITLWETEADVPHVSDPMLHGDPEARTQRHPTRRFFEASPQERTATIPLAGQPTREIYEVSVQI